MNKKHYRNKAKEEDVRDLLRHYLPILCSGNVYRSVLFATLMLLHTQFMLAQAKKQGSLENDSLRLREVVVFGKSRSQQLREGAYAVSVLDTKALRTNTDNLADILGQLAGVKVRSTGGLGSDFDISVSGMNGNSIQYFINGVPMNQLGHGMTLQNIPIGNIERVEIYKGVVPAELGADALGGAINIITRTEVNDYLDASVSAGSFATYQGELNARWTERRTGLILHPQVSYGRSKNNYTMHDMKVWSEEDGKYVFRDRERFHDDYEQLTASVETGIEHKTWADALLLSASYTMMNKELQTGATQNIVYGGAERQQEAWNLQARYRKEDFILKGLSTNVLLSHTWDNTLTVDTTCRRYDWNGDYTATDRNEITGRAPMMRRVRRPLFLTRANVNYQLAENHAVNFNYMLTSTANNRTDDLMKDEDFVPSKDRMTKHILGLTYNQTLLKGRMVNAFFVKDYAYRVHIRQTDMAWKTNLREVGNHLSRNHFGGGLGTRYRFTDALNLKASYERTVRLPLARELLGNGSTVYANLALRPEMSHNVNLGILGTQRIDGGRHKLEYEVNGYLRFVKDYIHAVVSEAEGTYQFENVQDVDVKGVEADIRYTMRNWLQVSGNITWQTAINKNRLTSTGRPSVTYLNEIPNRPWLFANGEAVLNRSAVFSKHDRIRLSYQYQYVHWFYLTWKGYGALESKSRIPTQHCHSASVTYSWQNERYALTLSVDNLADAILYDNYKLQKPGRNLMAKFRLYLR